MIREPGYNAKGEWSQNPDADDYGTDSKTYTSLLILGEAWEMFPDYRNEIEEVANEIRWIANTRGSDNLDAFINDVVIKLEPSLCTVEQVLAAGYPSTALSVHLARNQADDETMRIFSEPGNGTGDANAFKHAYWNALAAHKAGDKLTRIFMSAHEFGWHLENQNDPVAMQMDMINNDKGREIGRNYNPYYHLYNIRDLVMNDICQGELVKISNGTLVPTNGNLQWRKG